MLDKVLIIFSIIAFSITMYAYRVALDREQTFGFHRVASERRIIIDAFFYILITALLIGIYYTFSSLVGTVRYVLQGATVLIFLGFSAIEACGYFTYKVSVWKHPNDNQTS
jgi:hypothetical protein